MTIIHLSEILNVIETHIGLKVSKEMLTRILSMENIVLVDVSKRDYRMALVTTHNYGISINNTIAYIKMKEYETNEIYTFNKHSQNIPDIKIVRE